MTSGYQNFDFTAFSNRRRQAQMTRTTEAFRQEGDDLAANARSNSPPYSGEVQKFTNSMK